MAVIEVLDQNTINQIAAGEVVERPASIVKELVENALDAQSNAITVEIKGGGIDFIRVTDNGSGIPKKQVKKAFLRHATSKISSAEDLETVASLGFRGEALSSIAAVAKVELITKTDEGISGVRYVIEGGIEVSSAEIGCPEGTTFVIRNLFYNTPARRKFLKSKMTEAGYVEAFLQRLALSHPKVAFKFICDNKNKIATSGNGNLKDVIYHIFGRDIAMNLLSVAYSQGDIEVCGFVGKPVISRGNRNYENYFVNERYLKNSIISKAIEDGYKGHSMVHKFPFTVLMISMDPHLVDVNVHPAKMEMRFKNGEELYSSISMAVKNSFLKKELIPRVTLGKESSEIQKTDQNVPEPFEKKRREIEQRFLNLSQEQKDQIALRKKSGEKQEESEGISGKASSEKSLIEEKLSRLRLHQLQKAKKEIDEVIPDLPGKKEEKVSQNLTKNESKREEVFSEKQKFLSDNSPSGGLLAEGGGYAVGKQVTFAEVPLLSKEARPKHRIIGQIFKTYWLVEFEEKLFFVDQHAAHEKVMYEKLKKNLDEKTMEQQMVAPPIILTFSIKERECYLLCQEAFAKMGYLVEEFGGNEYCIRAVPSNLFGCNQQDLFVELLDQMDENTGKMNLEMITDRLATMACKAAVKGNQTMTVAEMDALMNQLLELENPYQCPHGRPTIISMTKYELEKKFKRIQ